MNSKERLFALKVSLVMATRMLGLFMLFPVMSVYAGGYSSTTPLLIGLAIGVYGLTQACLQIPFGYLSDRFGRKPMLFVGLSLFLLGSIVAASATDILFVVIGRALQGGGAISAVLMAFLADLVSKENRAKANAFVGFQIGLAFMLSLLIGPIIASSAGMSGLFWVIAGLSVVAMFIVFTFPSVKPISYYKLSLSAFKEILNPQLMRLDFSVFSLHLILACGFIVMPLLLIENNIVAIEDNWQLYLPAIIISFIGMAPLIIASEKYKKTKLTLLLSIGLLIISQALFFSLDLSMGIFLILLSLFFIAFNAVEAILPSLLSRTAGASKRGLAMGVFSTSQFLGTFIGGAIGGLIYDIFDLNSVFLLTIFMAIIWWLVILTMPSKNNTTEK
ncbi:MAG TPA: MFS transporter [Candidatus Thioglobus sp.]|nr:MFS transporter [Candidatus Thioglobus sp.]HIL20717.1 MFS transporter [Candidatus Thioglobus sp.]